ncbi:MAG: alpha/beta hydrolase [Gammaproteobacteria bacterium]|nr:alpha/beta hydrolase [Gammaproteobacteria bacterium]
MDLLNVDGMAASVRTYGAGEPIVALHATASSGDQWQSLALAMPGGFQVLAPEFYGHGSTSPWPGQRAFTLSEDVEIASAVVRRQAWPVHLVGHSYGGAVALRVALEQPERVRSLTLIEPVAMHLLKLGDARDRRLYVEVDQLAADMAGGVLTGHYQDAMRCFIDYWNGEGAWWRSSESRRESLGRMAGSTLLHFIAVAGELTSLAAYRRIRVPTLLLRGRQTRKSTERVTELLARNIRGASSVVVEGAGHMLPLTHPELVNAAVSGHILEYSARDQRPGERPQHASAA